MHTSIFLVETRHGPSLILRVIRDLQSLLPCGYLRVKLMATYGGSVPSYTAEIQTAMAELLRCWNQSHDNLLVVSLVTRYGTVYVSAEVTMDRRAKALGLWDVVIYPEMAGAVPRGKLAGLFRDFLRDMLVTAECNGFIDISVTAVRTLTSSSARPGHIIGMRFLNGRRTK